MRTSESITQNEINAYAKFCAGRGVIHDGSQDDQHNANFVSDYFVNTWKQDITEQNLNAAWEYIHSHLKLYTPAQAEYLEVANREPDRANKLVSWVSTQGGAGQLVNEGDELFQNLRLLLLTLHGYDINATTISHAIDRVQSKPGPKLHYVQAPRRTEPISPAAKADDGKPFLGDTAERLNEPRWLKLSRERNERDAREAADQQSSGSSAASATAEAKQKAESLQGGTHAETEQLKKLFATSGTEISWPETLALRLQMQKQFDKAREVRRFVR